MKSRVTAVFLLLVLATLFWTSRVSEGYSSVAVVLPTTAIATEVSSVEVSSTVSVEFADVTSTFVVSTDWAEPLEIQTQATSVIALSTEPLYDVKNGNWTVTQDGEFIEFLGLRVFDETFPSEEAGPCAGPGEYVCGSSLGADDMCCTGGGCPSFACSHAGYTAIKCSGEWTCTQVPGSCLFTQSAYVYQKVWGTCEYCADLAGFVRSD